MLHLKQKLGSSYFLKGGIKMFNCGSILVIESIAMVNRHYISKIRNFSDTSLLSSLKLYRINMPGYHDHTKVDCETQWSSHICSQKSRRPTPLIPGLRKRGKWISEHSLSAGLHKKRKKVEQNKYSNETIFKYCIVIRCS